MPFNIGGFTYDSTFIQNYTKGGIVTDGLVLHLDAAYANSYPKGGTTWYDLQGNYNGTLTNGPTYNSTNGGSIVFDGSNDYIISENFNGDSTNAFSVFCWVYPTNLTLGSSDGNYLNWIINKRDSSVDRQWQLYTYNSFFRLNIWDTSVNTNTLILIGSTQAIVNNWYYVGLTTTGITGGFVKLYVNGTEEATGTLTFNRKTGSRDLVIGSTAWSLPGGLNWAGSIGGTKIYNRALSAAEILQNYNATRYRFSIYEDMTYTSNGNTTITGNGSQSVSMFKTSGTANVWDTHVYSTQPFTAPCTIEFYKAAGSTDNSVSYAMIGWNSDPTTNASYDTLDWAAYPYRTDLYVVYHNGSNVHSSGTWDPNKKFYIVYDTDGWIRHYNGSTLLYSANKGTGGTVYVDSAYYSVNSTFGGFSSVKVSKKSWNGTSYV
jgi:hypothetical protein